MNPTTSIAFSIRVARYSIFTDFHHLRFGRRWMDTCITVRNTRHQRYLVIEERPASLHVTHHLSNFSCHHPTRKLNGNQRSRPASQPTWRIRLDGEAVAAQLPKPPTAVSSVLRIFNATAHWLLTQQRPNQQLSVGKRVLFTAEKHGARATPPSGTFG